jgi:hypothetical protein
VREQAAAMLLPSERAEAEATHARWFGRLGTDAERARLGGIDGTELFAYRRPMLDDFLAASQRMASTQIPGAAAWGGHALLAAGRLLLQAGRGARGG